MKRQHNIMRSMILLLLLAAVFITYSCIKKNRASDDGQSFNTANSQENQQLLTEAQKFFKVLPDTVSDPKNIVTPAKVDLGKMLFYDTRLSKSNTISCNSCHNISTYGVDNNFNSLGHHWTFGGRNSPTVMNSALNVAEFWDGRASDVEDQAKGPILNPVEMGMPDKAIAVDRVSSIPEYVARFKEVFPEGHNDITINNIADAIGAFERTLMTPSKFDRFLNGDVEALTTREKKGLKTFMDAGCTTCHNGAAVGGGMFQKFGLVNGPYWKYTKSDHQDKGRYAITKNKNDMYVFKVPILRNINRTYPYFHDGSVWDLRTAVDIMGETQIGQKLTAEETDDIVAFLKSLTGEIPEYALKLPVLPPSSLDTPRPMAD
ncbi:MAG TPA: cytochrome-c peroxidase [Balneolales bacterium]|nr:cytochrome-c peroxidase [Balneolales bacterium]